MTVSAFLLSAIWCALGSGTAENPPLVAPLEPNGEPQAFWWDAQALHVGARTFPWTTLGLTPTNGCKFTVALGETALREKIELKGQLRAGAARCRIGSFGQVGNAEVKTRIEATATAAGKVKSFLSANGATQNYVTVPMERQVAAGATAAFDIATPQCSVSGRFTYRLTDVDGQPLYTLSCGYRDPKALFDWQYVWTDTAKPDMVVNTAGWCDDPGVTLHLSARDYTSDTLECWAKDVTVGKLWGRRDVRIGVGDLPPGFYWLHPEYRDASGRTIATDRRFPYLKPAAHMPWEGTTLGAEDTVPPPWTPPEFADDGFRNWNPKEIWMPSSNGLGMGFVFDTVNTLYGKTMIPF